jgi:hypothetical protein
VLITQSSSLNVDRLYHFKEGKYFVYVIPALVLVYQGSVGNLSLKKDRGQAAMTEEKMQLKKSPRQGETGGRVNGRSP